MPLLVKHTTGSVISFTPNYWDAWSLKWLFYPFKSVHPELYFFISTTGIVASKFGGIQRKWLNKNNQLFLSQHIFEIYKKMFWELSKSFPVSVCSFFFLFILPCLSSVCEICVCLLFTLFGLLL